MAELRKLKSVSQFCETYPIFSIGAMRSYIFFEDQNGLKASGAILRLGRKILINDEKFMEWIENQNGGQK
jgi:hypothetical protein